MAASNVPSVGKRAVPEVTLTICPNHRATMARLHRNVLSTFTSKILHHPPA
jgi:hypothetical protein